MHLAFYPVADQLREHGVGAVIDLASPERTMNVEYPIRVIRSGPMLTHPNGYPLDAWGSDGYGIGCDSKDCVTTTIERLQQKGARVIKIALDDDGLDPKYLESAVKYAHKRGLKVVAHALTDQSARLAGRTGVDVLAHTPLEPLSQETLEHWVVFGQLQSPIDGMPDLERRERAVITTLAAFGGSPIAINNLRALRGKGVTVLYGTDLGNLRVDGPSSDEMELMKSAGMTDDEVRASMTTVPWHFWGFDAIEPK